MCVACTCICGFVCILNAQVESKRKSVYSAPLKPGSHHKGDLFALERQRTGNKRQRQETEDSGEGKGTREMEQGYLSQGG